MTFEVFDKKKSPPAPKNPTPTVIIAEPAPTVVVIEAAKKEEKKEFVAVAPKEEVSKNETKDYSGVGNISSLAAISSAAVGAASP